MELHCRENQLYQLQLASSVMKNRINNLRGIKKLNSFRCMNKKLTSKTFNTNDNETLKSMHGFILLIPLNLILHVIFKADDSNSNWRSILIYKLFSAWRFLLY